MKSLTAIVRVVVLFAVVLFLFSMAIPVVASDSFYNEIPVAEENEALHWRSGEWCDENGETVSFSGPEVLPVDTLTVSERI